jgi:hypothetical protein
MVAVGVVLLGATGCGGGTPRTGEMAVLPSTYRQKEKENIDGFLKSRTIQRIPATGRRRTTRGT